MTRYAQESRHLYLSGGGIAELAAPLNPEAPPQFELELTSRTPARRP